MDGNIISHFVLGPTVSHAATDWQCEKLRNLLFRINNLFSADCVFEICGLQKSDESFWNNTFYVYTCNIIRV